VHLRVVAAFAIVIAAVGPVASASVAADLRIESRRGVQEMVAIVKDLDRAARPWLAVGGFVTYAESASDPGLAAVWDLPPGARVSQRVIGPPQAEKGFLRLVQISGVPQVQIRSSARPFDTGGIFNVNAFVKDMPAVFESLRDHGYIGFADPSRYVLSGKPYAGAMMTGPDGITVNLISRLDPEGARYGDQPPFGAMGHVRNATQMVKDYDGAVAFFRDALGWHVRWEATPAWEKDGANNMGLPPGLVKAGMVTEKAASLTMAPDADGGTVEIFAFTGRGFALDGRDFAAGADPPNLGLVAYRIHVPDLDAYLARIARNNVRPVKPVQELTVPMYGRVKLATVKAPSGARLEFFQQLKP
jgi:predicted enzyme related to lactoylglutathione lyase